MNRTTLLDLIKSRGVSRVPEAALLARSWFVALHRTRSYGAVGANPITFAEIDAFARLMRWPLEPHHVELILAMDRAWLAAQSGDTQGAGLPSAARQPVTPEAFDAVFG